ncbi:hypothetical protein MBEHAL_0352 [Halarchaeum acidiphilum MH1-52-1]|uniref:Uncharacterized protein n=1 Tax=Halarchaeum acidiphilum MH1-52-1 TaxID=1261545 RepID=U2YS63_9EURY|nr:hypothetical protein MBEHAL_0352 [Halarchaeum acidiphilum MH1-52-1]
MYGPINAFQRRRIRPTTTHSPSDHRGRTWRCVPDERVVADRTSFGYAYRGDRDLRASGFDSPPRHRFRRTRPAPADERRCDAVRRPHDRYSSQCDPRTRPRRDSRARVGHVGPRPSPTSGRSSTTASTRTRLRGARRAAGHDTPGSPSGEGKG